MDDVGRHLKGQLSAALGYLCRGLDLHEHAWCVRLVSVGLWWACSTICLLWFEVRVTSVKDKAGGQG